MSRWNLLFAGLLHGIVWDLFALWHRRGWTHLATLLTLLILLPAIAVPIALYLPPWGLALSAPLGGLAMVVAGRIDTYRETR